MIRFFTSMLICISILYSSAIFSQNKLWQVLDANSSDQILRSDYTVAATEFNLYSLDYNALVDQLSSIGKARQSVVLSIPITDENMTELTVTESTVLPPSVAKKYPGIRTYRGLSPDGKIKARLSHGALGFYALIFTGEGMVFIEPAIQGDKTTYQVYKTEHAILDSETLRCGFDNSSIDKGQLTLSPNNQDQAESGDTRNLAPVTLRVYKLALAAAGEYTQARGGTVQAALSHMAMTINSVNEVFINDVAIKFEFIDRIEDIIYVDPATDPYPSVQAAELLNINTTVLNNVLGFNKYDVGHVFSQNCTSDGLNISVAGISQFQIVCSDNKRGGGVSCHFGSDFGLIFTTAHEFGHHFGAGHTWSNCPGAMGQLAPGSAFEPGSGSTIMSYGHTCGSQNVGPRDYFFHVGSIDQMRIFSRQSTGSQCPDEIDTDNEAPTATIVSPSNIQIPISTPFELKGQGTDDGTDLTYTWEQYNLGPTSPVGDPTGNAPSFVSEPPSESPVRLLPNLNTILASTTNEEEVLPTYSRNLKFRFTVRDNHPDAGGVTWDEISFDATEDAGPFAITYPHFPEDWVLNSTQRITWNVANTDDVNGVNCQSVDIFLSTDAGQTFPYVLAENTPNDGSEEVLIPSELSNRVRVKVAASDNIFFDVSNYNFHIIEPTQPGFTINVAPTSSQVCLPAVVDLVITSNSFLGYDSLITLDILSDLPDGTIASFEEDQLFPSETTILSLDMINVDLEGDFEIIVQAIAQGGDTITRSVNLTLVQNDFSGFAALEPQNGSSGVKGLPTFSWQPVEDANSYEFILATNPSFEEDIIQNDIGLVDSTLVPSVTLDENTLYYWRMRPINECGPGPWTETQAFHTITLDCQQGINDEEITISFGGTPTINSRIDIQGSGQVADVNVPKVRGIHDFIGQVTAKLISPAGTEVTLFANECFNLSNFNLGFDDDATSGIPCPLLTGDIHRPEQPLASFNGEEIAGEWIMRIEDNGPGGGGAFQEWRLEICSNTSASNPYLVINDTLKLAPDETSIISNEYLLAEDDDNSPQELVYTLVTVPSGGTLYLSGQAIHKGDQFTQSDLDNAVLEYSNTSGIEESDNFQFTVIDGQGGWLGIAQFNILIDGSVNTSVFSPELTRNIKLFPNPSTGSFYLESDEDLSDAEIQVFDLKGWLLRSIHISNLNTRLEMSLPGAPDGVYIVRVISADVFATRQLIIQH